MKNKKSTKSEKNIAAAEVITAEQAIAEIKMKYPEEGKVEDAVQSVAVEPKPKKEKKPSVNVERISFLRPLIEESKYSAKELIEMAIKKFPSLTESTIRTFLTDSKNPKYNKFDKLVVADEDGRLMFKK